MIESELNTQKSESNPVLNFGIAIGQFVGAAIISGIVSALLSNILEQQREGIFNSALREEHETTVLVSFIVLFVLILFIENRLVRRLRR